MTTLIIKTQIYRLQVSVVTRQRLNLKNDDSVANNVFTSTLPCTPCDKNVTKKLFQEEKHNVKSEVVAE